MTDSNSYIPQDSPQLEFVYNNESDLKPRYWPVFYSQFVNNKEANELYNDDLTQYITYSGVDWKRLMVSKEKDGRYRNFTMKSFSGESFNFYFELGSLYSGSPSYYSGPVTISGSYKVLTYYSGEANATTNCITFTAPVDNASVFVLPDINTSNYIKLHHRAVASGESYRLSQFLPRTLIQVDDLEADVIDAVTIRVSDSIVIGPDMIGDKTLLGRKIVDGTISGILMTDGTITGSKIVANTISGALITAGTITADRIASKTLTASQIQDAAITGSLIQAGTVSGVLITDNTIAASKIQANTITANQIAVSGITADRLSVTNLQAVSANTGNLSVNGNLTVTSGQIDAGLTTITPNGITVGNFTSSLPSINRINILGSGTTADIVGMAFYNSSFSTAVPLFNLKLDSVDVVEFDNNQSTNAQFNFNFPDNSTSTFFNIFNGDLNIKRTGTSTTTEAPVIEGYNKSGTLRYKVSAAETISAKFTAGTNYISNSALSISTDADFFNDIFVWSEQGGVLRIADNNSYSRFLLNTTNFQSRNASNAITFDLNNTTGNTRVYGDFRVDANFTQFNFGSMTKNTAQTVNAGVTAKITFQVAGTNGVLDDLTNNQINIVDAGLYLIVAGVVSTTLGLPWQVVSGGAFNSGVLLAGVTQAEGRAYSSKMLYLNPGELELWLSNTGGTNAAISTGNNGAILSVVKVG